MTPQQLKEELQEASGVNQIFVPQKNQTFAEGLTETGKTHLPDVKWHLLCVTINKLASYKQN